MKAYFLIALIAVSALAGADDKLDKAIRDYIWPKFQKTPHMIDSCAIKLAGKAEIDRHSGWPSYCNDFESTDVVKNRVVEIKKARSNLSERDRLLAEDGKIRVGMSAIAVESSWGRPESVRRTITASSFREQWIYSNRNYVYIVDGIVDAIQN